MIPKHQPKQIEFIEQRKKSDCGIACVAMLADKLYPHVQETAKLLNIKYKNGLTLDQMFEILDALNKDYKELKSLPKNGRALVAIQWKNQNLSPHFVVWDPKRNQFLDPLFGLVNKNKMLPLIIVDSIWRIYG